jgi:hypothetical protein
MCACVVYTIYYSSDIFYNFNNNPRIAGKTQRGKGNPRQRAITLLKLNIMLTINVVKNVSLENVKFSKHSLVLLKIRQRSSKSGEINTSIKYIEVCELKNNKPITAVMALLKYSLAEFRAINNFESEFECYEMKAPKVLNPFLNTDMIYSTDKEGKIATALKSEIPLKDTALGMKNCAPLFACLKANFNDTLYGYSKGILRQCTFLTAIGKELVDVTKLQSGKKDDEIVKEKEAIAKEGASEGASERPSKSAKNAEGEKAA